MLWCKNQFLITDFTHLLKWFLTCISLIFSLVIIVPSSYINCNMPYLPNLLLNALLFCSTEKKNGSFHFYPLPLAPTTLQTNFLQWTKSFRGELKQPKYKLYIWNWNLRTCTTWFVQKPTTLKSTMSINVNEAGINCIKENYLPLPTLHVQIFWPTHNLFFSPEVRNASCCADSCTCMDYCMFCCRNPFCKLHNFAPYIFSAIKFLKRRALHYCT
jgi:hypothetical protein